MTLSEEFLMGIAAIAIALVGFSGVVISLGRRGSGRWSPSELLQLRTLVEPSIITLFGALAPSIIAVATEDEEAIWRFANGLLFIGHCIGIGGYLIRGSNETIRLSNKIVTIVGVIVLLAMLASALGLLRHYHLTFGLGLLVGITASVHNFYQLLFTSSEDTGIG